jgi:hypothetical protein
MPAMRSRLPFPYSLSSNPSAIDSNVLFRFCVEDSKRHFSPAENPDELDYEDFHYDQVSRQELNMEIQGQNLILGFTSQQKDSGLEEQGEALSIQEVLSDDPSKSSLQAVSSELGTSSQKMGLSFAYSLPFLTYVSYYSQTVSVEPIIDSISADPAMCLFDLHR